MSSAKITLIGMWRYLNDMHSIDPDSPTLFDRLSFPEGIDPEIFKFNTLDRGGEFEVIYADPEILIEKVGFWSGKWYRTFDKWVKALAIEYAPLENYDRHEEETRTPNLTDKRTPDLESKRTADLEDKRTADLEEKRTADLEDQRTADLTTEDTPDTTTTYSGSRTEEKEVSAFDSSSYQPAEKLTITDNSRTEALTGTDTMTETGTDTTTHTGTDTVNTTGTDTMTHTGTDTTTETGTDTTIHIGTEKWSRHEHGNIGITSSQMMLESELTIAEWSLYDHLSDVFIREFCIPVYV